VKGSYTVEAAFVLPCVIFTIVALMYFAFYMHDKNRLQAVLDETLIKSKTLIQNETNMNTGIMHYDAYLKRGILYSLSSHYKSNQSIIIDYIKMRLETGLFIATVEDIQVNIELDKIEIKMRADIDIPLFYVRKYFSKSGLSIDLYNFAEIQHQAEFIRIFDVFTGVTEKVDIVNQTLKELQQVLEYLK
jgi:hypothetical protein